MLRYMLFCLAATVVAAGHGFVQAALLALALLVAAPFAWLAWVLLAPPRRR